jgi:hypothetical protein
MTSSFVPPQSRNWSSSDTEGESEALDGEMDGVSALKTTTLSSLSGGEPSGRTGAGAGAGAGEGRGAAPFAGSVAATWSATGALARWRAIVGSSVYTGAVGDLKSSLLGD